MPGHRNHYIMAAGKHVISIAACENFLRTLAKNSGNLIGINAPPGNPLYEFDDNLQFIRHYYLGNQQAFKKKWELQRPGIKNICATNSPLHRFLPRSGLFYAVAGSGASTNHLPTRSFP